MDGPYTPPEPSRWEESAWSEWDAMSLKEQLDAVDEEREVDWLVEYAESTEEEAKRFPRSLISSAKDFLRDHPKTAAWIVIRAQELEEGWNEGPEREER